MNLEFILKVLLCTDYLLAIFTMYSHLLLKHTVYISFRRIEIYTIMAIYNILY